MKIVVGPSEMLVIDTPEAVLVSSSLGAGIGLVACDSGAEVSGILHFLLPSSRINPSRAQKNPYLFADTGIPEFLDAMYQCGARKQKLKLIAAGGSYILDQEEPYDIAQRNCMAAKSILTENGIPIVYEDFGGNFFRVMRLENGYVFVEIPGHGETKI